jgi:ribosomal protein S12 methylthiotransferase accessory factor
MMMSQLKSLLDVVSPLTGIIKTLNLRVKSADQPTPPYIYETSLSHFNFRKAEASERAACGKGETEETAMLGAIGEALERYCAAHPPSENEARRAAFHALTEEAIPPGEFVLYSDRQYARKNMPVWVWKPEDELLWSSTVEMETGRQVLAPAGLVYMTQVSDHPQDALVALTSSGFAAGPDLNTAVRSAILELIERDAFVITWLGRLPAPEIDLERIGGIAGEIYGTYKRWGTEIRAFALQTDMPAMVVMAVAMDQTGEGPAVFIGLGCELRPKEALRKALFEICQMHETARRRYESGTANGLNSYTDVGNLEQHAAYFFRRDHLHEFDFLLARAGNGRQPIENFPEHSHETVEKDLRALSAGITAAGYRAFYRDMTTSDLEAYPVKVVRALVTQLQPIAFGHGYERLGGRRLYERGGITEDSINPCPHPLA